MATAGQNAWLAARGAEVIGADPIKLLERGADREAKAARAALRSARIVPLKTHSTAAAIETPAAWGQAHGCDAGALGLRISEALAAAALAIVQAQRPAVLISAGGETSSAICRALGRRALAVGRNIQPRVPLCVPIGEPRIPTVLKSGNFGSKDFYGVAIEAAERMRRNALVR